MIPSQNSFATPIGNYFAPRFRLRTVALVVGLGMVGADFWLIADLTNLLVRRSCLALAAVFLFLGLSSGDRATLGLTGWPLQPISYWIRATLVIAGLLLVPLLLFGMVVFLAGWDVPIPRIPPEWAGWFFLHYCVIAPLLEEPIYRLALCVPTSAAFGPTVAIILSGVVFAAIHFVGGNPGPDNFLAGYILAWAYLKSGSLMVPLVLHSLGNAVAFAFQCVAWYVA